MTAITAALVVLALWLFGGPAPSRRPTVGRRDGCLAESVPDAARPKWGVPGASAALGVVLVGMVAPGLVPFLLVVGAGVLVFERRRRERRRHLEDTDAMVEVVDEVVRDLRSGRTLAASLMGVLAARSHTSAELGRIVDVVRSGRPLRTAVAMVDESSGSHAVNSTSSLVLTGITVLLTTGGPAAASLERLSETIRAARADEADRRAQAAQAMASAVVLSALPLVFAAVLALADPAVRSFYFDNPGGAICLAGAATLSAACLLWIDVVVWGLDSP